MSAPRFRIFSQGTKYITLPQNLLINPGTLYENFEVATDWTAANGSVSDDTTNYRTGLQSVKLTASSGATPTMIKTVNWDLSGNWDRLILYYRMNDVYTDYSNNSMTLSLSETTDFSKYYRAWHAYNNMSKIGGWCTFTVNKADMLVGAGSPSWNNPIIRIRVTFGAATGKTSSVSFDGLYFGIKSIPAVIFRFDDGYVSQYSTAFQYCKSHNIRGEVAVDTSKLNTAGYLTTSQVQEMDAAGWSMVNHTNAATDLTTLSEAEQESQISGGKTALQGIGLTRCADYLVFPSGGSNVDTGTAMVNLGVKTGQTTNSARLSSGQMLIGHPFLQILQIPGNGVDSSITLAAWESWIDLAIAGGYIMPCHFHDIGGSGQWTATTFQSAVDYLISKKDLIYPITIDDYYNLQSGSIRIPKVK
jgi:peptidoglycan/xylan/chitin deacetylase (PgdA/CDA1 family)